PVVPGRLVQPTDHRLAGHVVQHATATTLALLDRLRWEGSLKNIAHLLLAVVHIHNHYQVLPNAARTTLSMEPSAIPSSAWVTGCIFRHSSCNRCALPIGSAPSWQSR